MIDDVLRCIDENQGVVVVGPRRSGKSHLAYALARRLPERVRLSQPSNWWALVGRTSEQWQMLADREIQAILNKLSTYDPPAIWVVDDADVLLTQADDSTLLSIAAGVKSKTFRLVLIRNRFVLEEQGWYAERERLVDIGLVRLPLLPVSSDVARSIAGSLLDAGPDKNLKVDWLVAWSGGLPGLISDLHQCVPSWPSVSDRSQSLDEFETKTIHELDLAYPVRSSLIAAIVNRTLPNLIYLTDEALRETGYLTAIGMVAPSWIDSPSPFIGRFWETVAHTVSSRDRQAPVNQPEVRVVQIAESLATALVDLTASSLLASAASITQDRWSVLARALARALTWEEHHRPLARPTYVVLAEVLGRKGLRPALTRLTGIVPSQAATAEALARQLLAAAGKQDL